jgi:uncharacterized membrane protein
MLKWFSEMLCESPDEPSIRRVLCLAAFLFGCGLCLLGLRYDINGGVKDLATTIIIAAFSAVGIGRFAEAMDKDK